MFESKIFHEHANMSGIVLMHHSVLFPVQSSVSCFDAFC